MRNLTIPCALLVLGAVVAACDVATPTESAETLAVATLGCADGFTFRTGYRQGLPPDRNNDGAVCEKAVNGKKLLIDNNVPGGVGSCPDDFQLTIIKELAGTGADRNADGRICVKKTSTG